MSTSRQLLLQDLQERSKEEVRLKNIIKEQENTVLKAWNILSSGAHRLSNFERVEEAKDILLPIVEQIPPK